MEILESNQYLDDCRNLYYDYKSKCSVQSLQSSNPNLFYDNLEQEIDNLNNLPNDLQTIEKIESLVQDVEGCYELRITYNQSCYVYAFNNFLFNKLKSIVTEGAYTLLKAGGDVDQVIDDIASLLKDPINDLETVIESIVQSQDYTEFKNYIVPKLAKYVTYTEEDLTKSGDEINNHLYPIHRLLELNRKLKDKIHTVYLNLVNERYMTLGSKLSLYKRSIPFSQLNVDKSNKSKTELVQFIKSMFERYNNVQTRLQNLVTRIDNTTAKVLTEEFRNLQLEISPYINE